MAAWTDCCRQPNQGGFRLLWLRIWQSVHWVWQTGGYPHSKCAQDHTGSHEVLLTIFSRVSGMSTGNGSKTCCKSEAHKSLWDDSLEIFRFRDGMNPGFPGGSDSKESACIAGDLDSRSLGGGHGNPSSILAWRIPWTEEPGGLQFVGSQRVRHDWETYTHWALAVCISNNNPVPFLFQWHHCAERCGRMKVYYLHGFWFSSQISFNLCCLPANRGLRWSGCLVEISSTKIQRVSHLYFGGYPQQNWKQIWMVICTPILFTYSSQKLEATQVSTPLQYSCLENPMDRGDW